MAQIGCTGGAYCAFPDNANRRHHNTRQRAGDSDAQKELEQRKAAAGDSAIPALPARTNDNWPGAIAAPRLTDSARLIISRSLHAKVQTICFSSRPR